MFKYLSNIFQFLFNLTLGLAVLALVLSNMDNNKPVVIGGPGNYFIGMFTLLCLVLGFVFCFLGWLLNFRWAKNLSIAGVFLLGVAGFIIWR